MRKLILLSFVSQALGFILHYLTLFVLVRIISVEEFGLFQKFNLFLTTILPFIGFTLVSSLYYFYPKGDEAYRSKIITQTLLLLTLSGFGFFLLIFVAKLPVLGFLQLETLAIVPDWIFLIVPFYLLASLSENIFLLDKKNRLLLFYFPAEKLLFLTSILCFYYLHQEIAAVFYGIFIFSVFRFLFILVYVFRSHHSGNFSFDRKTLAEQLKYCIPFYVANVAYILSIKFDKLYLNRFISTAEFAIYSISFISIPLLANAFNSINNVAMTEITTHLLTGEKEKVRKLYRNIVTKSSALALPFVVFFFINGTEILTVLFTDKYAGAVKYYRIYLLSFLVSLTSYGLILRASNQTRLIFRINLISSIIAVGIGFVLIPYFTMTGAICTAVIAMCLPGFLQLFAEIRLLGFSVTSFFPIRNFLLILGTSLLASPAIFGIRFLNLGDLGQLILSAVVYFVIIIPLLYFQNLLPFQDKLQSLKLRYTGK